MKVAVVGAGIVGASAARFLAGRGHSVTIFEQFPVGHAKGSSHGRSRIVRKAYPDAFYTGLMAEAYPLWADLEAESGRPLLHEVGLLYAGHRDAPDIRSCADALAANEVPFEVLASDDLRERGIPYRLSPDEVAIWTPEAGYVRADWAVRSSLELAVRAGAAVRVEKVEVDHLRAGYDAFVVAAGSWVRQFAPLPVRVSVQTFAYLEGALHGPVWIEDGSDLCYGFPTESNGSGHKIGIHRPGPTIEADQENPTASDADLQVLAEASSRRFGFSGKVLEAHTCRYTNTQDEAFLFGRLGESGFFASACSGHGFKFGPWVGRCLADFVEGADRPENHARFLWTEDGPQ